MPRGTPFKPGNRLGVKGRPKGIIDKRMRLNKSLMADGDALLKVTIDKALAGDMGAMSLLLPKMMANLKPEGAPVRFEHDTTLSPSKQIESVLTAIAAGQLTVEEGLHVVKAIESLASVRSMEGGGADDLVAAFKQMARGHSEIDGMPIPEEGVPSKAWISRDPKPEAPPPVEE